MSSRKSFDPRPLRRKFLLREAEKIRTTCWVCRQNRPCTPSESGKPVCGPCHYGSDLLARETLRPGKCCNDCAFRKDSPEQELSDAKLADDCTTELDFVKKHADVFYCHKPFLEPQQEWGYDPKTKDLIPLIGEHWQPCAGWWAEMRRRYGIKGTNARGAA